MSAMAVAKLLATANGSEEVGRWIQALETQGFGWKPVGGISNNSGAIEISSDPAETLNERITNAIDAVLEREWQENHLSDPQPGSPREAAEWWFKIPRGKLSGLSQQERRKLAERIQIILLESGVEKRPTILVKDTGIGQHPSDFEKTLLSLHLDNKIEKHFLMGAYGQGGAAVYDFSRYTVIVSRRVPSILKAGQRDLVGWTIIRYNPLDEEHKTGTYEYILNAKGEIPTLNPEVSPQQFQPGTQIRMIEYELPKHFTIFTAPAGSLWALTNMILYDPVLPFLIGDARLVRFEKLAKLSEVQRTRVIIGNANRLREKKAKKEAAEEGEDGVESELRYDQEHTIDLGDYGKVKIRYWIFNFPKKRETVPVDAYSDAQSAIAVTLNGQRQAKFDRSYFRTPLNLPILKDYMLVQIDCDELTKLGKRELFSSTRQQLKQRPFLDTLLKETNDIIAKDPQVRTIAEELRQAALKSASSEQNLRLSRQLEQLIKDWEVKDKALTEVGLQMLVDGKGTPTALTLKRKEEIEMPEEEDEEEIEKTPPDVRSWAGKYFPTEFDFVAVREPLKIPQNKAYTLMFKSDAQDDCLIREHDQGKLYLEFEPRDLLVEKSRGEMRSGRLSVRVITTEAATPDRHLTIRAKLTFPGKQPFIASRRAVIVKSRRGEKKPVEVEALPKYRIVPVHKEGDDWKTDEGSTIEALSRWSEDDVAEVDPSGQTILIYVNMSNRDYVAEVRRRNLSEDTIRRYRERYTVAIAFHAYLQDHSMRELEKENKRVSDEDRLSELQRAVKTVIFTTFVAPQQDVLAAT
jgi:hypothetical protein